MRETFKIKGVDIEVEYNDLLYSSNEVKRMLKRASTDVEEFFNIQSEIEIINEPEVEYKLFGVWGED